MANVSPIAPSYPLAVSAATLPLDNSYKTADRIRETIDAAAAAGFDGMSISTNHYDRAVAAGMPGEAFFEYHQERGLSILAAEVILAWAISDETNVTDDIVHILDVSAASGARTVIVATLAPELPPLEEASSWLRHVSDLAADRGLCVSFEFLPWSAVPSLASAIQVLEAVNCDNFGLVIDAWHWLRQPGGPDLPLLRTVAPERIHLLHLDDAPLEPAPDLMVESGTARLLPGEGAAGVAELLDVITEIGATPGFVTEVFSASLRKLGAFENARRQYQAGRSVLDDHAERVLSRSPVCKPVAFPPDATCAVPSPPLGHGR